MATEATFGACTGETGLNVVADVICECFGGCSRMLA
jgi:hypothetical protein